MVGPSINLSRKSRRPTTGKSKAVLYLDLRLQVNYSFPLSRSAFQRDMIPEDRGKRSLQQVLLSDNPPNVSRFLAL